MKLGAAIRLFAPRNGLRWSGALVRSLICTLFCCLAAPAFTQQTLPLKDQSGTIAGTVVDPNGNFVLSAKIHLTHDGSKTVDTESDADGHFLFSAVAPGPFQVTITVEGFAPRDVAGDMHLAETIVLPPVFLVIAAPTTEVRVTVTTYELAEEQVKIEETQRVLGVIPNYFVSYQQVTLALKPKQKFELAWKTSVDPVTIAASGAVAGIEQAQNTYSGYGQGGKGFAKRFGASYGDAFIGIMIGGAILPALLKQDPRYFYKGIGSNWSRAEYAIANAVMCKGDNGRWQVDYSGILGGLAAGGISNLYYPAKNRNGFGLTLQNTAISIGGSAIGNLFQEFVVRKLTPHTHGPQAIDP